MSLVANVPEASEADGGGGGEGGFLQSGER